MRNSFRNTANSIFIVSTKSRTQKVFKQPYQFFSKTSVSINTIECADNQGYYASDMDDPLCRDSWDNYQSRYYETLPYDSHYEYFRQRELYHDRGNHRLVHLPLTIHVTSYSIRQGKLNLHMPTHVFNVHSLAPPPKDICRRFTGRDPELANIFFSTADHEAQYRAMLQDAKDSIRGWRRREE